MRGRLGLLGILIAGAAWVTWQMGWPAAAPTPEVNRVVPEHAPEPEAPSPAASAGRRAAEADDVGLAPAPASSTDGDAAGSTTFEGMVTDLNARPLGGAHVAHKSAVGGAATSDPQGRYRLRVKLPRQANCVVLVRCEGFLPRECTIGPLEPDRCDIRLTPAPRITGTLTDARGRPVAGYALQANAGQGSPLAIATSSAQGMFVLSASRPVSDAPVTILEWRCNGHGLLVERPLLRWGDRDVPLVVKDAALLELRVLADGKAVRADAYRVSLLHHQHQELQGWSDQPLLRGTVAEDVLRLAVIPGTVSLVVVPDAPQWAPSAVLTVTAAEGPAVAVDVPLERAPVLRVHARDHATGAPVVGVVVTIEHGAPTERDRVDATVPFVMETAGLRTLSWRTAGVLSSATTGSDGLAIVRLPAAGREATVQCRHADYRTWSRPLPANTAEGDMYVDLERANTLRGTLVPAAVLALRPSLRAVVDKAGTTQRTPWAAVDKDSGAFELVYEGEGRVELDLALNLDGAGPVLAGSVIRTVTAAEAALLRQPGSSGLVVDAAAYLPGVLAGTAFVDGQPPRSLRVHRVEANGSASAGWAAELPVGSDGAFQFDPMLAGEWLLEAVPPPVPGTLATLPLFFARANVRARQVSRVTGDMRTVRPAITIVDANGAPLDAGQQVLAATASCPTKQLPFTLGAAGLLRANALPVDENLIVQVVGGRYDKQRGEAAAGAAQLRVH